MSNNSDYLTGRDKINYHFLKGDMGGMDVNSHQFNFVSANLSKFLPDIPFGEHKKVFQEMIFHNRLTHFEQCHMETFDYVTCDNLTEQTQGILKEKPCILSSFHFGSYRLLNTFLIKNEIPYTIVIPKDILEKEGETLRKIYTNGGLKDDSKFIEVESPALGLKMLRELKNGRSIFIYFDGFRGAGDAKNANEIEKKISFFGENIFARKGVAYLAKAANVPLITAISYRKSLEDIRLHFFDPIIPERSMDKDQFANEATQLAYSRFMPFLKKYPGQWESWLYLHKQIDQLNTKIPTVNMVAKNYDDDCYNKLSFNLALYGLFIIENNTFVFNKNSYLSFPLDKALYDLLLTSSEKFIEKRELSIELFGQLSQNNVLIPYAA